MLVVYCTLSGRNHYGGTRGHTNATCHPWRYVHPVYKLNYTLLYRYRPVTSTGSPSRSSRLPTPVGTRSPTIVDEVDSVLEDRFITEANSVLDNVLDEVNSQENACPHETMDAMTVSSRNYYSTPRQVKPLSRLSVLRTFITDSLLEKLKAVANRAHLSRGQKLTTV